MPWRMTWRREEHDLVGQSMIDLDEFVQARIDDREDLVDHHSVLLGKCDNHLRHVAATVRFLAPVLPFDPPKQVARIAERRDPFASVPPGVPADVIQVQVGAEDDVDRLGRIAGFGQSLEGREFEVIPAFVVAVLVVADTGVDDDPSPLRFNDERLDRVADFSVRVSVVRV